MVNVPLIVWPSQALATFVALIVGVMVMFAPGGVSLLPPFPFLPPGLARLYQGNGMHGYIQESEWATT